MVTATGPGFLEIAGITFELEPGALYQGEGGYIVRLDVRLHAMKFQCAESKTQDQLHCFGGIAAAPIWLPDHISHAAALKRFAFDEKQTNGSDNPAIIITANEEPEVFAVLGRTNIFGKSFLSLVRVSQPAGKPKACIYESRIFMQVGEFGRAQENMVSG
jgi:hypothetical protein